MGGNPPPFEAGGAERAVPAAWAKSKTPPPNYVILRPGANAAPEVFHAESDEECIARLQKLVRGGQAQSTVVYCYKLMCAEEFQPSSRTLTPEDIRAALAPATKGDSE